MRKALNKLVRALIRIGNKYRRFVERRYFWVSIAQTRVLVSVGLLGVFTFISISLGLSQPLQLYWLIVGIYCFLCIIVIFLREERLRSGRVRIIADGADVLFISSFIAINHNFSSSLFWLYLFPVLSAARYKRTMGTAQIALLVAGVYLALFISLGPSLESVPLMLWRFLVLFGVALVAGSLTKDRQLSDVRLTDVLRKVTTEIIRNPGEIESAYQLILNRAMDITDSEMGHMRRVGTGGASRVVAHSGLPEGHEDEFIAFTGAYSSEVIKTRGPIKITRFSNRRRKKRLSDYFEHSPPRCALFVPLIAQHDGNSDVIAVIAVYSKTDVFYSKVDAIRIQSFTPLLEIAEEFANQSKMLLEVAQKFENLSRQLQQESEEQQHRLQMLHELAEHFEQGYLSTAVLQDLVESIMLRLNSEEAAIFLWDKNTRLLMKEAEWSPDESITARLKEVEVFYRAGDSLTGKCYQDGEPYFKNDVPIKTQFAEEYSNYLPSQKVSHLMAIPLMVGNSKTGVLRVINKKADDYDKTKNPKLRPEGFAAEDFNLVRTIAIQVAIALNGKILLDEIETSRRFLERAINYSPYPIILLDEKGKIKLFNHSCELIWQVSAEQAVKKSVIEFYESESEARRLGKLLDKEGQIFNEEAVVKDAHGNKIPIQLSASLIRDDKNNKVGSIGVFQDLREIRRAEELKLNTERLEAISRVMGYASHDLKNKLLASAYEIDTMQKQLKRRDLEKVNSGLVYLNDALEVAIDKLTNITMTQSVVSTRPNKQLVYVEQLFDQCLDRWKRMASLNDTALTINEFPKHRYYILADVDQIQMVLSNLYDNSADAINDINGRVDRRIEIAVQAMGNRVDITWFDTGCGIPKLHLGRVFDVRFTTKELGNGLGLYWAKNIIESHEGTITVESNEGAWTKFTIAFPLRLNE